MSKKVSGWPLITPIALPAVPQELPDYTSADYGKVLGLGYSENEEDVTQVAFIPEQTAEGLADSAYVISNATNLDKFVVGHYILLSVDSVQMPAQIKEEDLGGGLINVYATAVNLTTERSYTVSLFNNELDFFAAGDYSLTISAVILEPKVVPKWVDLQTQPLN